MALALDADSPTPGRSASARRPLCRTVVRVARSSRSLAAVALTCGLVAVTAPPAHAGPTIGVSAPQYESPGGTVPVIVTVYGVPVGSAVTITATGTRGGLVTCLDAVWHNPVRGTASRKCYLQLPRVPGSYEVRGTATLTRSGAAARTVTGVGRRPVLGNGRVTSAMPLERVRQVERCWNTSSDVWLTFDDGGSPAHVAAILDTLRRNDVRGRFFFRGDWRAANPALHARMVAEGHLVANHTYDHPALSKASDAAVADQIARGVQATTEPRLLRPPFGAGAYTTRLEALARARGYELCRWTTDTYDWQRPSPAQMAERVRYGDDRTPPVAAGGNILMHGTSPSTAYGLQRVIDAVRSLGLRLEPRT